jgi:LL-H family phage holin
MNESLFKIVLILVSLAATILTSVVIPYVKERLGNEKLAKYKEWTMLAVQCAEMAFPDKGMGESKKEYVVTFLNEMFNKNKIVISSEQIEVLIESAVKAMKLSESK